MLWHEEDGKITEIHEVVVPHVGKIPVAKGEFHCLPKSAQNFIVKWVEICKPRAIYICDGSQAEADEIKNKLIERGCLKKLSAYENNYITFTDPHDVARVESKTFVCTKEKFTAVPHLKETVHGVLAQWMSLEDLDKACRERFPNCMAGRVMYVIPYSMGPVGSPLSKVGIQLTDSNYVVVAMRVMTRVCPQVWDEMHAHSEFVRCIHSIGCPRPSDHLIINHWPCNPEKTIITHIPEERVIISFGSGYGGNSLTGKKCFALRIAGRIAYDEGWLAEHMLIMSVTNPKGEEKFIAAAFPSACGKTNMAMLMPSLPGYKVQVVGDDIAWMRFDENGVLRAINPEAGFFGVAPGTNMKTNPNAMLTLMKNSIFTNTAMTEDGRFFWEGLEDEYDPETSVITWLGEKTTVGDKSVKQKSHPNARFCCPAKQCPIIHPLWEDPKGVPISALIFGGRRPEGIPLVIEALNWQHGVMLAAQLKSEATAAAEFKGKQIMHDPMAMRPFVGYNFGNYLRHWLSMDKPGRKMPKIFHVNWFRLDENGKFLWPGFGENIRVIDWILRRCNNEPVAEESPVGLLPKKGSINLSGLDVNWDKLMSLPKEYLLDDAKETLAYLEEQVGTDLPQEIKQEIEEQYKRVAAS
ncbi:Protein kinase C-like 1 [Cichlidogyrus casuarinus]|uniref:phosphoenolpyruvate carboxykinase (GTP) n=1 Tax=Cichlidogyrus casuarinus TaxID=1844966 RepID=A0ABD2QP82_9PLAT